MRIASINVRLVVALVASLLLWTAAPPGCAGNIARDNVGLPALSLAAVGVLDDAHSGLATLPESEQPNAAAKLSAFEAAIESKDRAILAMDALPRWADVRALAEAGIAARVKSGALGPGVAASLTERLDRFGQVLARTTGPDP